MKSERLLPAGETSRFGRVDKCLLTGGAGGLGSYTVVVLSQSGHRVVLYGGLSSSSGAALEKLAQVAGWRIPCSKGDVRDTELLKGTFAVHCINAVVRFVGLKAVGDSVEMPVDYAPTRFRAPSACCRRCSWPSRVLMFSGSATVYGEPKSLPLEKYPSHQRRHPPLWSKQAPHRRGVKDVAADPAWRMVCLRYFNPVGTHKVA